MSAHILAGIIIAEPASSQSSWKWWRIERGVRGKESCGSRIEWERKRLESRDWERQREESRERVRFVRGFFKKKFQFKNRIDLLNYPSKCLVQFNTPQTAKFGMVR